MEESRIKKVLEKEGIPFRGIQNFSRGSLVLFDNSYNSTLSISTDKFSIEKVREALKRSEERWGRMSNERI